MATPAPGRPKPGTAWQDAELDATVASYFAMLSRELAWQPYTKADHNAALMGRIGRSRGAIEYKLQNISAVLAELGMPWIDGYKPMRNYQGAIFSAIDRYMSRHPDALEHAFLQPKPAVGVFVKPPALTPAATSLPAGLRRLARKFDPVARDFRNRALGKAGEEFAFSVERTRLVAAGCGDLARKVRWVAAEDGDGAGYDILSFDPHGRERLLEVKTTDGAARTPFFLTRNERELASERPRDWRLYRVHQFTLNPRIFTLAPPLRRSVHLTPELWRASFAAPAQRP